MQTVTVTVPVPDGITEEQVDEAIRVGLRSLRESIVRKVREDAEQQAIAAASAFDTASVEIKLKLSKG